MAKRMWIQLYNASDSSSITLPINPESVEIKTEKEIKTHNILGYGQVGIRGYKKLQSLTLKSFLPDKDSYLALLASYVDKTEFKPYTTVETANKIDEWVKNNDIIRVIIADGLNQGVNKEFLISSFSKTMRESVADLDYELTLTEYDVPTVDKTDYLTNTKRIENKIKSQIQKLTGRRINRTIPQQMIVKTGQTIYKIARLYYGGKGGNELAKLNNVYNQNKDLGGQVLEMLPLKNVI